MLTTSDAELLRQYARTKSEAAFGEIVRRYADLVYSAARRQTDDIEEARDIGQMVFADLARKAGSVGAATVVAGWLYRGVRLQSLECRRNRQRRQQREREAVDFLENRPQSADEWAAVRPLLDDAMASLGDKDRDALLLRFFKNESLASVGGTLGVNEDAAQKRVSRALGKLREFLARHGVTTIDAALSATLAANAVEIAPGGVAPMWASGAVAGARESSSGLLNRINMKTAIGIAALAGGLVVLTVLHVRALRHTDELEAALQSQAKDLAASRDELEQRNTPGIRAGDDSQVLEIARLRARIDRLRSELDAEKARAAGLAHLAESRGSSTKSEVWPAQVTIECAFLTLPVSKVTGVPTGQINATQSVAMMDSATNDPEVNLVRLPKVTTLCGRQAHVAAQDTVPIGPGTTNIGLSLDVLPDCSTNSETISLQILVRGNRLTAQSTIEEISTNAAISVPDGNSFVLTMEIPGNGPWFAGDPTNSQSSRSLVVLLTATLIDPAGNRLFPNDSPLTATPSGIVPGPASPDQ